MENTSNVMDRISTTTMHCEKSIHLTEPILRAVNLTTGYCQGKDNRILSKQLTLSIKNGELVCLLGPNGCGKSTLMRTIAGLQKPLLGDVLIENQNIIQIKPRQRALLLSLVLTDKVEGGNLTVADIVAVGRFPHTNQMGLLNEEDKLIMSRALGRCGLQPEFAHRLFAQLSDGEKQRVMIARALAQDTPLIMLDEPTAHLDLPNRIEMMKTLRQLAKETNKAILLSTHELDLALQWADSLWLMSNDGVIRQGAPEDMVLNGSFSEVFGGKSFHFDKHTGTFKMQREHKASVRLIGSGVLFEWTRRALEREGFDWSDSNPASSCIEIISKREWLYKFGNQERICQSIGELLSCLRHEAYYLSLTK